MIIRAAGYNLGYKVVSIVKNDEDEHFALSRNWNYIRLHRDTAYLLPENIQIDLSSAMIEELNKFNSLDVFEIDEDGFMGVFYDNSAQENVLFITGRCNSNCIMCPASDYQRKNGVLFDQNRFLQRISQIPYSPEYLTITGGEPFLAGKQLFPVLFALKNAFPETKYQILTNGRIFANLEYCHLLRENIPCESEIGIPIHGPNADIHDMITQAPGSFYQTFLGLKHLLSMGFQIELRIVASGLNVLYLESIADLIIKEFKGIRVVRIMGLEMMGSAVKNKDRVWIPYRDVFLAAKEAIKKLILNGIDVSLYNFPLCAVDREYWALCSKSISGYKVRYAEGCVHCSVKDACGGFFRTSLHFAKDNIRPIEEFRI